jgi:hypothetical protein
LLFTRIGESDGQDADCAALVTDSIRQPPDLADDIVPRR